MILKVKQHILPNYSLVYEADHKPIKPNKPKYYELNPTKIKQELKSHSQVREVYKRQTVTASERSKNGYS